MWRPSRRRGDERTYDAVVRGLSRRYGVEFALIKAVVKAESDFNPHALSPKGAQGLMQLMPGTASRYGVRNAYSPLENLAAGARHLGLLLSRFGGDLRLAPAAHKTGGGAVRDYGGGAPFL